MRSIEIAAQEKIMVCKKIVESSRQRCPYKLCTYDQKEKYQNSIKFQNPRHKIEKFRELITDFQLF